MWISSVAILARPVIFPLALVVALLGCGGGDGGGGGGSNVSAVKTWGTAEQIDTNDVGGALFPQIAFDRSGNALAVWGQNNGSGTPMNIWYNTYIPNQGWGTAGLVETNDASSAHDPQIVFDGSGNAIAVWVRTHDSLSYLWASIYVPGQGWGTEELIGTNWGSDAFKGEIPDIACDGSGNCIVVWSQYDGMWHICTNIYVHGKGWSWPEQLESNDADSGIYAPQIAFDRSGNAIAVWAQSDGARTNVWAKTYTLGEGWGVATLVGLEDAGGASGVWGPQIAFDGSGNAVAVWMQYALTDQWECHWIQHIYQVCAYQQRSDIWASTYGPGVGWGTPALIEVDDADDAEYPQLSCDGLGNCLSVWSQYDGTRWNIRSSSYVAGAGWGAAELVETIDEGSAYDPQIACDGLGNAIAVWVWYLGGTHILSNTYVLGAGWGWPELIETQDNVLPGYPQIALDNSGNAIAVWHQWVGGQSHIWANTYR